MCTIMSQSYIDIPLGHTKELTFNISEKPKQNKNDKTSKKEKSTTSENQVRTKIKVKRAKEKIPPSSKKTVEKITSPRIRNKEISINDIQKNRRKILVPKELEKVFDKETSAEWSKVKLPVKRKVDKTFLPATDDKVTTGEDVSKFAKALSALCEVYSR